MLCGVCFLKVGVVGNVLLKCRCGSKGTSWLYMVRVVGAVDVGRGGYVRACAGGVLVLFLWVD
jgi:hypothetical protein